MSDTVHNFATAARDFCAWVESAPGEPASEAVMALRHLMRLYQAVLDLPNRFDDFDLPRLSNEEWKAVFRRFGELPFNYYAQCFDPLVVPCEEPVVSDLADDLADIWRDIKGGLALYDAGHPDAAVWEWKQHFESHWGHHAAGAIYALHCWLAKNPDKMPSKQALHDDALSGSTAVVVPVDGGR
jgi:Domain of unknown function (DUF5063)